MTCYVCLSSDGNLVRACGCTHLVHLECLEEVIRRVPSHATHCAVCKTPYACVIHKQRRFLACATCLPFWTAYTVQASVLLGGMYLLTATSVIQFGRAFAIVTLVLAAGGIITMHAIACHTHGMPFPPCFRRVHDRRVDASRVVHVI